MLHFKELARLRKLWEKIQNENTDRSHDLWDQKGMMTLFSPRVLIAKMCQTFHKEQQK